MPNYTRYAVYYLPPDGSDLANFGAAWLGWDNLSGAAVDHPEVGTLDVSAITQTPRKYGFHGTMKPPFRLAEEASPDSLKDALGALAADTAAFDIQPLALKSLGFFLALVPSARSASLADLAGRCVMDLDRFRAAPSEAELGKRRAAGLSDQQEANLQAWGYPYVLDEFRFHLTLSGKLSEPDLAEVKTMLDPLTASLCTDPVSVRDVALLGEVDGGNFHLIQRFALTG